MYFFPHCFQFLFWLNNREKRHSKFYMQMLPNSTCSNYFMRRSSSSHRSTEHARHLFRFVKVSRKFLTFPHYFLGPKRHNQHYDSLRTGLSGGRIPAGTRYSAFVQTSNGAHLVFRTMGTRSFPGGKATGAWPCPPTPI